MKILIVTDSAALPSGLAETTRLIFETPLDRYPRQYEIHQVGWFHCYAVTQPQWPIYPTLLSKSPNGEVRFAPEDKWGQKTVPQIIVKVKPDIVFGFGDPQCLLHLCAPAQSRKHKLILHVNFDGGPLPHGLLPLQHADRIITKSEFAKKVLASAIPAIPPEKLGYMYSPADVERFHPVSPEEKAELRAELFPAWMPRDAFVLGWIGRNQWRKQVWLLYKVIHYLRTGAYFICQRCGQVTLSDWDPCLQRHSDEGGEIRESPPGLAPGECAHCKEGNATRAKPLSDIFLWLHMPEDPEADWPVPELEKQFNVRPGRDLFYTEGYELKASLAPDGIPLLYQTWDCLLYLSGGEGFGLPAWEAMCSGLPAIYTNYSSHAELLGRANAGIPVGGVLQPEAKTTVWRMIADCAQVIGAVRQIYSDPTLRRKLEENGRAYISNFTREHQARCWHELFNSVLPRSGTGY